MRKNIDPREWGRCAWDFIFSCCAGSDRETNVKLHAFAKLMTDILPCERCRYHLKAHLAKTPFDETNPASWFENLRETIKTQRRGVDQGCSCSKAATGGRLKVVPVFVILAALLVYGIMKLM